MTSSNWMVWPVPLFCRLVGEDLIVDGGSARLLSSKEFPRGSGEELRRLLSSCGRDARDVRRWEGIIAGSACLANLKSIECARLIDWNVYL